MFLAALMVLSVFAMSVSFAGAAAAQPEVQLEDSVVWAGQTVVVSDLNADTDVQLRQGDNAGDSSLVEQLSTNADGEVSIDTEDLEAGTYFLRGAGAAEVEFEIAEQTLDTSFEDDSVVTNGQSDLNIDSNRATYDVEVTSEDFSGDELGDMFGVSDGAAAGDGMYVDGDAVVIEDAENNHNVDFTDVETGEYDFTVTVTDTGVEDTATISVAEEVEGNAFFDDSVYSEEAGNIVEFTVEMENTDSTVVRIEDDEGNYWTDLHVTADDGEDEVTVSFNTYEAGQDDSQVDNAAFSAENGSVEVLDQRDFTEDGSEDAEYRLLPSDLNLELYLASQDEIDNLTLNDDDRYDLSDLNEVDVATLVLNERSTGDITKAVAPADVDISSVDDIEEHATSGDEVAENDQLIVGVDVSGVFGYLGTLSEGELGSYLSLQIEQSNPEQYDSPNTIDEFDVIEDSENDRLYFVIDTEDANIEAGQEYDVTFSVEGVDFLEFYNDNDDDEKSSTDFSVVERTIEVTGDFDKEDRLLVPNDEEAIVTGESDAAPGTDVQVRLRATGEDPFLMSQTVEVQEDGSVEATFDLSEHQAGQEFTVTMTDTNGAENVQHQVNAILTESGPAPHSVVIHVEDADGNAVSGAEISVGDQSATTDDDGKATLELAHGEYKVNASYDGVEANGKLTVDDQTPDEVTLTLGEENVDYNEKANEDENKDDNQNDNNNDGNQNDNNDNSDDNNDDEQPGSPADEQPGFGIAVALIALLAAAGIALRRQ